MRTSTALLLGLALSACATTASVSVEPIAPFPPEVEFSYPSLTRSVPTLMQPPIWPQEAAHGYKRRMRLTLLHMIGPRHLSVRIDERNSGIIEGRVLRADRTRSRRNPSWRITVDRRFTVSRRQMKKLDALIAASDLWAIPVGYWNNDDICIDGEIMLLERRTPTTYAYSEGNTYCTTPDRVDAVWLKILEIAGVDYSD